MLEMIDQPDVGCRVSGGFGFALQRNQRKPTHVGWQDCGQVAVALPGWGGSHGGRATHTEEGQNTSLIVTHFRRDKLSVLYKSKQSFEVKTQ